MNEEMHNNDFEKELRDEADDFLLRPSDKVWKGIAEELHPRRRTYILLWAACILALLSLGIFIYPRHAAVPVSRPSAGARTSTLPQTDNLSNHEVASSGRHKGNKSAAEQSSPPVRTDHHTTGPRPYKNAPAGQHDTPAASSADPAYRADAVTLQEAPVHAAMLPVLQNIQPAGMSAAGPELSLAAGSFSYRLMQPETIQPKITLPGRKPSQEKPSRKPVFGLSFTPAVGYRVLKTKEPRAMAGSDPVMSGGNQATSRNPVLNSIGLSAPPAPTRQPGPQAEWGWTAGARVMFPFGKHWYIRTGASVTKTGYRILAYEAYALRVQGNGTTPVTDNSQINSYYTTNASSASSHTLSDIHNRYLHIEIPLLISRQFGNPQKVHISAVAGPAIAYLLKADEIIYSPGTKRYFTNKNYLSPLNANMHLGVNVNIPVSQKLMISIGPSAQYQLFSTYKNYPRVKEHPYLIGIKTGLQWSR